LSYVERMLFSGAPSATGGAMRPDLTVPGHGMTLAPDADQFRVA
jgi:hypothetical protein